MRWVQETLEAIGLEAYVTEDLDGEGSVTVTSGPYRITDGPDSPLPGFVRLTRDQRQPYPPEDLGYVTKDQALCAVITYHDLLEAER